MARPAQTSPRAAWQEAGDAGLPPRRPPWYATDVARTGVIAVLAAAVCFVHLGSYGLWEPDEARYAEIAREMLSTRDFILPHLNYVPYVEKPPLLYWLTALSFAIFGQNEFAARLIPALSGMFGVIVTYLFAHRVFGSRRAMLAAAVLATAPVYAVMAQVLTTDMLLSSLVTVAMFAFFLEWSEGRGWRWLLYVAMGLGTLAKGPVAIALPVLAAIAFLAWHRELRNAFYKFKPISGFALTFAIAAPWFIAVSIREPGFVSFYFVGEHLRRFFEPSFSHGQPFYYYVPVLMLGLLPWSIIVLFARPTTSANAAARRFCLIAASVIFVFFSLASGKLIPYILPAFSPLALAIADTLAGWAESRRDAPRDSKRPVISIAAPGVLAILGFVAIITAEAAALIPSPYPQVLHPVLLAGGAAMMLGAVIADFFFSRRRTSPALAAVALTMVATLVVASYGRIEAGPLRSFADLSRAVAARAPKAQLICYHRYVQSLAFYAQRRVILVGPPSELRFGKEHSADSHKFFFTTDDDLMRLWNAPGPKVLLLDEPELEGLRPRLGDFTTIASEGDKRAILREER